MSEYLFTSESVTEGHPDKMCDQVSDAILDALSQDDKRSRVACETLTKTGFVMVAGEITTTAPASTSRRSCATRQGDRLQPLRHGLRLRRPAASWSRSSSSRPTSPRASTARASTPRGAGRRRPGHDVRLRVRRDQGADAAADPRWRTSSRKRLAEVRKKGTARLPAPRRQDPGLGALRGRPPAGASTPSSSRRSTARTSSTRRSKEAVMRRGDQADRPGEARVEQDQVLHQPDRPLRRRRADGRLRPHRPQDHRRHLRRHGPPRRRRVLRQGSVEGRSLGRVLRALHREERRRRGARAPLRGAGRLRDRRRRAGVDARRHVRHRHGLRRQPGAAPCARRSIAARAR